MNPSFNPSRLLAVTLSALFPLLACAAEPDHDDPLLLDAAAIEAAGIELAVATPRTVADELKAPGEVRPDAYSTVLVAPRVDSQVLARKARLGDIVEARQPLVVLSSVDVAATQGELIVAEQDWRRIAELGPRAVSARRYNEARVERDQARAKLRAYGLSDGQITALLRAGSARADGSYELLAPTRGRVTSDEFLIGERVAPGRTLFTLVEEDTVWVEARLSPADAAKIDVGRPARILAHGASLAGTVVQRAHRTEERTRTAPVRIEVDNSEDLLHPGELVDVRIGIAEARARLVVAVDAVVLLDNQPTVFVTAGTNRFAPAAVVTGESLGRWVVIEDGLAPETTYVKRGAFALKARLLRSRIGEH